MPDGENFKTLVVYPGQTLLFISKDDLDASEMNHAINVLKEALPSNIKFVVVDGSQFEVAVLDDRKIESYVPEDMYHDP